MEITKNIYTAPTIEIISIDNEISLALESTPAEGPGESAMNTGEYFKNNPFHSVNG